MNIQLIQGEFNSNDALELITQLIQVKIKYHETKINVSATEEDIKQRESKIKLLQKELYNYQGAITSKKLTVNVDAVITINEIIHEDI